MEWLNNAWTIVSTLLGTVAGGFIVAIFCGILKGISAKKTEKFFSKFDDEKIAKRIVERINKVTVTHTFQPIVESQLVKINEKADRRVAKHLEENNKKLDLIHEEIKALARYFDGSLGVTDEAKKGLALAISNYENTVVENTQELTIIAEEVKDEEKVEKNGKKTEITTAIEEKQDTNVVR